MLSKNNRFFGALLLVAGTTIGAGMLALPTMTGIAGFFPSLLLMVFIYLFMLLTGLYLLEVNLRLKGESNLISMVRLTLGKPGEVIAWIAYLLLLYTITAAYLVGCSQIIADLFSPWVSAQWVFPVVVFLFFAVFLYLGTQVIDIFNRFFMVGLFISYFLLISLGLPHIDLPKLGHFNFSLLIGATPIIVTSFGYHIIIPTLVEYLEHDARLLKRAIIIGVTIPLVIYLLFQMVSLGAIPLEGEAGLTEAAKHGTQTTLLLRKVIENPLISYAGRTFAFCAIVTSLIGVALSLSDFLADGLKIKKDAKGKFYIVLLTLLPPLAFALFYPQGFVLALRYAGIFVVILLALLPAFMAYFERYGKLGKGRMVHSSYKVFGGKGLLLSTLAIAWALLVIAVIML